MVGEFAHVVFGAMDEARFAAAKKWQPQHNQPRGDDATVMLQGAVAAENRHMQPAVIRPKAGRPDDGAHLRTKRQPEPRRGAAPTSVGA